MTRKKPTKKEIETVISSMVTHLRYLEEKFGALDSLFGLYLDWKKETNTFNKFVETKIKERQEKENEPGETK